MPNDTNTFYMVDLDFCRYNVLTGLDEYIGTTVYNPADKDREIEDMKAAGWYHYMTREW